MKGLKNKYYFFRDYEHREEKIVDKFDNEIVEGCMVDVQLAGIYKVFFKNGFLVFKPYRKWEKVVDYFSNDLIIV